MTPSAGLLAASSFGGLLLICGGGSPSKLQSSQSRCCVRYRLRHERPCVNLHRIYQ